MKNKSLLQAGFIGVLVALAAMTRILPHFPNFTAMGAMALFGAAHFKLRWQAFLVPLIALYMSDLVLNNVVYAGYYENFTWQIAPYIYVAFILILGVGFLLRDKVTTKNVVLASLSASVIFFLLTNAAAWMVSPMYTKDVSGLMMAYAAGIPFFRGTLAGDLVYSGVLFGGYAWAQQRFAVLKSVNA